MRYVVIFGHNRLYFTTRELADACADKNNGKVYKIGDE